MCYLLLCRFAAAREPCCIPGLKDGVLSGSRALYFSIIGADGQIYGSEKGFRLWHCG